MSWPLYSLDQLGSVSRGRSRHRPRDAEHLYGGPYPFIQTGDVKHAPMYLKHFSQTYNDEGLAQSKLWPKGTLCITIAANIAETGILDIDACFPDSIIGFVPDKDKTNSKFIKYQFDALLKTRMRQVSHGAAQDNLSQQKLLSFEFPVPDLATQEKLVERLSNYDDLIENNRRRIALLEESARLLYREWFVHFRFPEFENTHHAEQLPDGWSKTSIGEYCPFQYGKALKAERRVAGKHPVFGSSGVVGWHQKALVKGPGIVIGRKGNVGSVYFAQDDFWPIDTTYFITGPNVSEYLFLALTYTQFLNTDVAVPGLNRDFAHSREIILPPENYLERFQKHASPIFKQIKTLNEHSANLVCARDLLLPRLMDGRITL